ncbi:MAG: DUF1294 domain-containing protein [Planctomycetaceae bacterium]
MTEQVKKTDPPARVIDWDRVRRAGRSVRWFIAGWLALALVWLIAGSLWTVLRPGIVTVVYLWLTVLCSAVAFVLYGLDKRQAESDSRRISEGTLHLIALLGGWPGAFFGQQVFRHKTQKLSFLVKYWLIVALHLIIMLYGLSVMVNPLL